MNSLTIKSVGMLLLSLLGSQVLNAQTQTCKQVLLSTSEQTLDTVSISPLSIKVVGLQDTAWQFDFGKRTIRLRQGQPGYYQVCYQTLTLRLDQTYQVRSRKQRDSTRYYLDVAVRPTDQPIDKRVELFSTPSIQKSGSLSRGLSLGSNQGAFVNSALNLQLQGQLTEGLQLTALINDQQLPFQPQGNTAQIRELDRVLVQLDHKYATLQAGDVIMQQPQSHFLKYYKNVLGARLTTRIGTDSLYHGTTTVGAAIAKGKFASTIVPSQEGVQGPYRLRSPNNEIFIVIQANSERVYIDNVLKQRGYNQDYVIDYNTGEITFTPRVLITRYTRIRVDFEYAERNFSRSILEANHYQRFNRLKLNVNFYREEDDGNRPVSFTLDDQTRSYLSGIGDSLDRAIISGASLVSEFSQDQVLYIKKDTTVAGFRDSVFVFSPTKQDRMFTVVYTDVGQGRGHYVLASTLANGRVYRWVGPGLGTHLPLRRLALPNRRQMFVVGSQYQLSDKVAVGTELALSQLNNNLFAGSPVNVDGNAQQVYISHSGLKLHDLTVSGKASYERLSSTFSPIDRFRYIEFDRDWSANTGDTLAADDHLLNTQLNGQFRMATGQFSVVRRTKGQNVNGWQGNNAIVIPIGKFRLEAQHYWMQNARISSRSDWQRLSADASYLTYIGRLGYKYSLDQNRILNAANDSVTRTAMYFDEQLAYWRSTDTSKFKYGLEAAIRQDYIPFEGRMALNARANTVSWTGSHKSKAGNQVNMVIGYRQLNNISVGRDTTLPIEETIQGRIDWQGDYFSRHIRTELTVASGVGRELQREYRFVRVANPAEGTHQWIDYNNDGVQQLDEFIEAARPEDRLFIKIFVPTNTFVNAYSTNLNYKLTFMLPRYWSSKGYILRQLAKLSGNIGWTLDRKVLINDLLTRFNPALEPSDANLLSTAQAVRANLYFNRTDPGYGGDLSFNSNRRRALLTAGFESQRNEEIRLAGRCKLGPAYNLSLTTNRTTRELNSNFLTANNYTLTGYELMPELSYQPDGRLRLTGSVSVNQRQNLTLNIPAQVVKYGLEARFAKVGARSIGLQAKYIQIGYGGEVALPAAYDLLEGLQPGQNLTWTVNWQQTLFNGLQLNLNYDGRQSQGQQVIHIGRAQVTALF